MADVVLKFGNLKSYDSNDFNGLDDLLQRYHESDSHSEEEKTMLCELIDKCNSNSFHLWWEDRTVNKEEAKKYVMNYQPPSN